MDRNHAVKHLKALAMSEHRLAKIAGQYAQGRDKQRIRDRHKQNADALDLVLKELEEYIKPSWTGMFIVDPTDNCEQEPRQEGDEYVCICGIRWDIHEERPTCQRK